MIDVNNLPQDKKGEGIAVKAIKAQFDNLSALIANGEVSDMDDLDFYIWHVMNDAAAMLED